MNTNAIFRQGRMYKYILFCISIFSFHKIFSVENLKTVSSINWSVDDVEDSILSSIIDDMSTKVGDPFTPEIFDADVKVLSKKFDEITPQFSFDSEGLVDITINASLRPIIRDICWNSRALFLTITKSDLLEQLNVNIGSRLDRSKIRWGNRAAEKWLATKGYPEAKICVSESLVGKEEIILSYNVDLGNFHYLRAVKFIGINQYEQLAFDRIRLSQAYDPVSAIIFGWGIYDDRKIEQDRFSLLRLLRDSGYADAQVESRLIKDKKGAFTLVFIVDRGNKYSIRNVQILSDDCFDMNRILREYFICSDAPFSKSGLSAAKKAIENLYGSHGYVEAKVNISFSLIDDCGSDVDIMISVSECERLRVKDLCVIGNLQTDTNYILDKYPIASLDYFNTEKLRDFENVLLQTKLFEAVHIYPSTEIEDSIPGFRNLIIEVIEQSTGSLSMGLSYGSGTSWKATLEVSDCNFNVQGLFNVYKDGTNALRGQGEYISLALSAGNKFSDAKGSFFKEKILGTYWGYGFDFFLERIETEVGPVQVFRKGLGNRLARRLGLFEVITFKGRAESIQSSTLSKDSAVQIKKEVDSDFFLHGIGLGISTDRVMGNGFYLSGWRFNAESELIFTKGNVNFDNRQVAHKLSVHSSFYLPFLKGILKANAIGSELSVFSGTFEDIPYPERLFTDQNTVSRGFRERSMGLRVLDEFGNKTSYAKGGDRMFSYSFEYAFPMTKDLAFFTFFDWSYLSLGSSVLTPKREGQMQSSIGYGVHIGSVLGVPVSLGFGYPVVQIARADDISNFFFLLGKSF